MISDFVLADGRADGASQPNFPQSHGRERVDDRRVLSGIIFVYRNRLMWRDAPREYGPAKTLCNRWKRRIDKGIFIRMMKGPATPQSPDRKMWRRDAPVGRRRCEFTETATPKFELQSGWLPTESATWAVPKVRFHERASRQLDASAAANLPVRRT